MNPVNNIPHYIFNSKYPLEVLCCTLLLCFCSCNDPDEVSMDTPFHFNSSDKYISVNTDGIPASSFTYEFWFKTDQLHEIDNEYPDQLGADGLTNQNFVLFPLFDGDNARGTGISVGRNGVSVYEHKNNYLNARIVFTKPMEGWNHVAVVYENNGLSLYINGKVEASRTATQDNVQPQFSLGFHFGNNYYFSGWIDEFRVWSRPLNEADVRSNMNFEYTGFEDGLEVYYNFDNIQKDNVVFDNSGNNRHGELTKEIEFLKFSLVDDATSVQNTAEGFSEDVVIEFPPPTNSVKYIFDRIEQNQYSVEITGWAFIKNRSGRDDEIYLVLSSNDSEKVYTTTPIKRTDIANTFGNVELINSGFTCKIPLNTDQPGAYEIGLLIRPSEGDAVYHLTKEMVNVSTLVPSGNITYAMEAIKELEGGYILTGYAYVKGFNRMNSFTRICLKSDKYFYSFETKAADLQLSSSLDKTKLKLFGFTTFINKDDLEKGNYEIGIQISNKETLNALNFTGNHIYNAEN